MKHPCADFDAPLPCGISRQNLVQRYAEDLQRVFFSRLPCYALGNRRACGKRVKRGLGVFDGSNSERLVVCRFVGCRKYSAISAIYESASKNCLKTAHSTLIINQNMDCGIAMVRYGSSTHIRPVFQGLVDYRSKI